MPSKPALPGPSSYSLDHFTKIVGSSFNSVRVLDYNRYRPSDPYLEQTLLLSSAFCFVLNMQSLDFIYMSENVSHVLGYSAKEWMKEGIKFNFTTYHPDDILPQKALHEDLFGFHAQVPLQEKHLYRYSHDFRVRKADGSYVRVLHQNTFPEADERGKPLVAFVIMKDITALKSDTTQLLVVERFSEQSSFETVYSKSYPVLSQTNLSEREIQVLGLLIRGLSSKQIAKELGISMHTVNTHRGNMLAKTGTNNTADLMRYAVGHALV